MRARSFGGAILVALLLSLSPVGASPKPRDVEGALPLLKQADEIKAVDHAAFLQLLAELHAREASLSSAQRLYLQFLDAWQRAYEGKYSAAEPMLRAIIAQRNDDSLRTRATALLINGLSVRHRYGEAYTLANELIARLPEVVDGGARLEALTQVSQMLAGVGQAELALKYVQEMKAGPLSGRQLCVASFNEIDALLDTGRLEWSSPKFGHALDVCVARGETVTANTIRLDQASLMTDSGRPDLAIALLRKIAPGVQATHYQFHIAAVQANLAQAYLAQGSNPKAKDAALATLAATNPKSFTWTREAAYGVLYKVEKTAGHDAEALSYYEKFVEQDKAAMDDAKARALAYQMVKQEVLAKKLRLDALAKQNKILQLRQELDHKAAETARLYVILLLVALGTIALWLYRLKHSQMYFRRMARHDGLTSALNRHHFLEEAGRLLGRLHKAGAPACLVVLDLDYFKNVNDTYGHVAGDDVLKRIAQVVRRELRASDVFGRLGGEEFGILMPSCTCEQGAEIAERIRAAMASTRVTLDDHVVITVYGSLGLACTDPSGYVLRQLLTEADAALYRAKRGGRNQVVAAREAAEAELEQG